MVDNREVQASATLALDIGGTSIGAALVTPDGKIIARAQAPTPPDGDPLPLLDTLAALATSVTKALPSGVALHETVGVALPGIYDRMYGILRRAVNLPRLEGFELREKLDERLAESLRTRQVYIDTDVIAAGWAQWCSLAPDNPASSTVMITIRPETLVYLSLGTGVGGSVISRGSILRHTRGGAGHLGHLIVETGTAAVACKCGARGCLEAELGAALNRGDEATAAARLAVGLLQIAHLFAPDRIALGGGVIDYRPHLVDAVRSAFAPLHSTLTPPEMQIIQAPIPSKDAGVIGAAQFAARCHTSDAPLE